MRSGKEACSDRSAAQEEHESGERGSVWFRHGLIFTALRVFHGGYKIPLKKISEPSLTGPDGDCRELILAELPGGGICKNSVRFDKI